jgi:hypothetical protein
MNQGQQNHSTAIIVAIITGIFLCIAAIIGAPFTKNLADRYIPTFTLVPTQTVSIVTGQETSTPANTEIPNLINTPIITSTVSDINCGGSEREDWSPINGYGQDIPVISGNSYIHAVLWRPNGQIKEGYDEVSVLIEPGTTVTIINVAGTLFKYYPNCSKAYVETQIERHNNEKAQMGKKIITISISELQTRYP